MKITKAHLKKLITEALEDQPASPMGRPGVVKTAAAPTSREKRVAAAIAAGTQMSPEEYTNTLKQVLLVGPDKVSPQVRKAALESIFGKVYGAGINALVLQMLKGAQQ